jgi:TorA maturation chaperone TorD
MSRTELAILLEELGASLLLPGVAYAGGDPPQVEPPSLQVRLDEALQRLQEAPREQLEVAYAGLFLHGYDHPTLHLEESVLRCGQLRCPEVLADLDEIYQAAGIQIQEPFEPDHLGAMASLAGYLLLHMDEEGAPASLALEQTVLHLVTGHLVPLQVHVSSRLQQGKAHPYYRAVLDLLGIALEALQANLPASGSANLTLEGA